VLPCLYGFAETIFEFCYLSQPATSFPIDNTKMLMPKSGSRFLPVYSRS